MDLRLKVWKEFKTAPINMSNLKFIAIKLV